MHPEDVLEQFIQSLSIQEKEEMEYPVTLDQVRRILDDAVAYRFLTKDIFGYKFLEIMWTRTVPSSFIFDPC